MKNWINFSVHLLLTKIWKRYIGILSYLLYFLFIVMACFSLDWLKLYWQTHLITFSSQKVVILSYTLWRKMINLVNDRESLPPCFGELWTLTYLWKMPQTQNFCFQMVLAKKNKPESFGNRIDDWRIQIPDHDLTKAGFLKFLKLRFFFAYIPYIFPKFPFGGGGGS